MTEETPQGSHPISGPYHACMKITISKKYIEIFFYCVSDTGYRSNRGQMNSVEDECRKAISPQFFFFFPFLLSWEGGKGEGEVFHNDAVEHRRG